MSPAGLLLMGVSGSGKTTLGIALANRLGWDFLDADDLHPPANIAKMAAGIPLTDSDRSPWLGLLHERLLATLKSDRHPVLACSALKEIYRAQLLGGMDKMHVIYLKGTYDLIHARMLSRDSHFMKSHMLKSQFSDLEDPLNALILDVSCPLEDMLKTIMETYFTETHLLDAKLATGSE